MLDRAKNLFEFLARTQQLRETPVRTTSAYDEVYWLDDLPDHDAVVSTHRVPAPEPEEPIFHIDRIPRRDAPVPTDRVRPWLEGDVDNPASDVVLVPSRPREDVVELRARDGESDVRLADHPSLHAAVADFVRTWQEWAGPERHDLPARELYGRLFSTHQTLTSHSEQYELVLGVSALAWKPAGHEDVRRHLFTFPVSIEFDESTGRLTVAREASIKPVKVELEMFDPSVIANPSGINALKSAMADYPLHPLDRDAIEIETRRFVNTLDASGAYDDADAPPVSGRDLKASFAPAVILRKRSQRGLIEIYERIVAQLAETGVVPDGLLPLVDPDFKPKSERDTTDGGLLAIDNETFLPMPVNERQLRVIESVDHKAQVVVQGPPGTGKTHTAAALLSHLLAQGKRVLVTAHTDRALQEVRTKLPAAIRPLSVAVVGTSQSDMADLRVAVETISARADDHDPKAAAAKITRHLSNIEDFRKERARAYSTLRSAREAEVKSDHKVGPFTGTVAKIAQDHLLAADANRWLLEFVQPGATSKPPVTNVQALTWLDMLRDEELLADEPDSRQRLIALETVPEPDAFARLVDLEAQAVHHAEAYSELSQHDAFRTIADLDELDRGELQARMKALASAAESLEARSSGWLAEAVFDVRAGRGHLWQKRAEQVEQLLTATAGPVASLGALTDVEVRDGELPQHVSVARALSAHLAKGGQIKVESSGAPKLGMFTPKVVKESTGFFAAVRVDGLPATTKEQLDAFLTYAEGDRILNALDRAWPVTATIPEEDTLDERMQWHVTELGLLRTVLDLGRELADAETWMTKRDLPVPNWTNLQEIRTHARLVDAAASRDAATLATEPLEKLGTLLDDARQWQDAGAPVHALAEAVNRRDRNAYSEAYSRLRRLHEVRETIGVRENFRRRIGEPAPRLADAVGQDPSNERWDAHLRRLEEAWAWAAAGAWLREQTPTDVNLLQAQIASAESRIRREIEHLAAERAWDRALAEDRITGRAQADLRQYAALVKRLGKGTGKYATKQRQEIREALDRCRPAVPVWIMPIYRIAEQLQVEQNMFDVVFVDEASQAGLEAAFLQYLAPKIVVIGDDKQVSPAAVGVDQQQIRDLANQYLAHDRYKASWQDPKRSLFDEAAMRFGGKITLVEHRRCLPEIIGFSNRIAYEPDNVRLIPVRQRKADALPPIRAVYVPDGYEAGRQTNPAEADAIAAQIVECVVDSAYDGMTMGVISLMGKEQAKLIESKLIGLLEPEEWAARDLRCGDASDFQGSERDVVFLSMVKAAEPGKRIGAATTDMYVQRYNVAASRAKHQMWLFHSLRLEDLGNPADMRHQLLDYVYGVSGREAAEDERIVKEFVPEDVRVEPFDSLFEQRVFNEIHRRGYTLIPQYPAEGYRIDLVVVGADGNIAIECDGDTWHGPGQYEADLARQRDLERCGWTFFRIRESSFYVDRQDALADLWPMLETIGKRPPIDARPPAQTVVVRSTGEDARPAAAEPAPAPESARSAFEPDREEDGAAAHPAPPVVLKNVVSAAPSASGAAALPRLEDEEPWTEAELDDFVDTLHEMIERTTTLVTSLEHEVAGPLRASERDQKLITLRSESAKLLDLGQAIRSVGAGTFGLCQKCGSPIGKRRLLARPQARRCIQCSQRN